MSSVLENSHKVLINIKSLWFFPAALTVIIVLALLGVYHQTVISTVDTWNRSTTFTHGYIIFPISFYLIWLRRHQLSHCSPAPNYIGLLFLAGLGFGWFMAHLADVLVVQQLCLVGMITAIVWSVLGWNTVKEIAFPLGFLLLAVPMGEAFIPLLLNFTADFTVMMVEFTGIPIYREGTFFSLPSGNWSVAEACSGIRYLIASITLGCLYAYLTYRSILRRLGFVVFAIVTPIIANGLRAFTIVMIGHYSNMELAVGIDHIIYGWLFFGLVMMFMFWIGSFWSEQELADETDISTISSELSKQAKKEKFLHVTAVVLPLFLIWPLWAAHLDEKEAMVQPPTELPVPVAKTPWSIDNTSISRWKPRYQGSDISQQVTYRNGKTAVELFVFFYRTKREGGELISSGNVLIPEKHPVWKMPDEYLVAANIGKKPLDVRQGRIHGEGKKLLAWRWEWLSGTHISNRYIAKLLEGRDKLLGKPGNAAGIIVATEYENDIERAHDVLQRYMDAMFPMIDESLKVASES